MPQADLGVSNSIIQAFLAGRAIAEQKMERQRKIEQDKIAEDQRTKENEFKQKQFDESIRQFDEQNKLQSLAQKALNAQREIETQILKSQMQEQFAKTGSIPGYKIKEAKSVPMEEGYAGTESTLVPENENANLPSFTSLDPISHAKQQADIQNIALGPKLNYELLLKEAERKAKMAEATLLHERRLEEIALRNRGTLAAASARGQISRSNYNNRPLPPEFQIEKFGNYSPDRTYSSTFKASDQLNPAQVAEFKSLDTISQEAQDILNEMNDPKLGAAWKEYFTEGGFGESISAGAKDLSRRFRGGETSPKNAEIAARIGKLKQIIAQAAFGLVIPKTENELLTAIAPTEDHRQPFISVQEKLKNIIKHNDLTKANALYILNQRQPDKLNNDSKPKEFEEREYDSSGKRIK